MRCDTLHCAAFCFEKQTLAAFEKAFSESPKRSPLYSWGGGAHCSISPFITDRPMYGTTLNNKMKIGVKGEILSF